MKNGMYIFALQGRAGELRKETEVYCTNLVYDRKMMK